MIRKPNGIRDRWPACGRHDQHLRPALRSRVGGAIKRVRNQTKGQDGAASLFVNGLGMRTTPPCACQLSASAPAHMSGASRMSADCFRKRSLSRRTRHPPPHLLSSGVSPRRLLRGPCAAGREPAAYRFLRAAPHALTTHVSRHELMPFVSVVRCAGVCERGWERGKVRTGNPCGWLAGPICIVEGPETELFDDFLAQYDLARS